MPGGYAFFGLAKGLYAEWGFFRLREFEKINKKCGFDVIKKKSYYYDEKPYTFVGSPEIYRTREKAKEAFDKRYSTTSEKERDYYETLY